jgi:hypothetical protein
MGLPVAFQMLAKVFSMCDTAGPLRSVLTSCMSEPLWRASRMA